MSMYIYITTVQMITIIRRNILNQNVQYITSGELQRNNSNTKCEMTMQSLFDMTLMTGRRFVTVDFS